MLSTAFEQQWPSALDATGSSRETFLSVMQAMLKDEVVGPGLSELEAITPYESIASGWYLVEGGAGSGGEVAVGIGNSTEHWIFREEDTAPHWAPWGPGSELAAWAEGQGIEPFLVARAIAQRGTKGNYNLKKVWERAAAGLQASTQNALHAWMLSYGTEG